MNLLEIKVGEKTKVININSGWGLKRRLIDLGITQGMEIEVISWNPFGGPILLKVGGTHVAIGRGIARKIEVEKI